MLNLEIDTARRRSVYAGHIIPQGSNPDLRRQSLKQRLSNASSILRNAQL